MGSIETYFDIDELWQERTGGEPFPYWTCGNPSGGVLGRSWCEEDVREVLDDYRRKGRTVRLVKVTREVVDP